MKKVIHLSAYNRNVGDNALNWAIDKSLADHFVVEPMELVGNPFGVEEFERLMHEGISLGRAKKFVSLLMSRQVNRKRCVEGDVAYIRRHYWNLCI